MTAFRTQCLHTQVCETHHASDRFLGASRDHQKKSLFTAATVSLQQDPKGRAIEPRQGLGDSSAGFGDDHQEALGPVETSDQQSDEEEAFEEREDDRANDPACIQCDDGGVLPESP